MRMASMRESRESDRFLVNTQVQSHALLRRGFGTSVPFIGTCKYSLSFAVYKLSEVPLIHPHSVVQCYSKHVIAY